MSHGAKKKKQSNLHEILVRLTDGRTWRVTCGNPELFLDTRVLPQYHPLVGVVVSECSSGVYEMLPIAFTPCAPAVMPEDLIHVKLLMDAGFINRRRIVSKTSPCRHVRWKLIKPDGLIGRVCVPCRDSYIKANVFLDGVWLPLQQAVEHNVVPPAAIPYSMWRFFRAGVPSIEPWKDPIGNAGLGHLAPVPPAIIDDTLHEIPPYYQQIATVAGLIPNAFVHALWRIFGSNELFEIAAEHEMQLVRMVIATPGCVFFVDETTRKVGRTAWTEFSTLVVDKNLLSVKPRDPAIEYPSIRTAANLAYAIAEAAQCNEGTAWINVDEDEDIIPLSALTEFLRECKCRPAITFGSSVRHSAKYLIFLTRPQM